MTDITHTRPESHVFTLISWSDCSRTMNNTFIRWTIQMMDRISCYFLGTHAFSSIR